MLKTDQKHGSVGGVLGFWLFLFLFLCGIFLACYLAMIPAYGGEVIEPFSLTGLIYLLPLVPALVCVGLSRWVYQSRARFLSVAVFFLAGVILLLAGIKFFRLEIADFYIWLFGVV